jgi:hypothetical protein
MYVILKENKVRHDFAIEFYFDIGGNLLLDKTIMIKDIRSVDLFHLHPFQ